MNLQVKGLLPFHLSFASKVKNRARKEKKKKKKLRSLFEIFTYSNCSPFLFPIEITFLAIFSR